MTVLLIAMADAVTVGAQHAALFHFGLDLLPTVAADHCTNRKNLVSAISMVEIEDSRIGNAAGFAAAG
jgi:hypothetical protein